MTEPSSKAINRLTEAMAVAREATDQQLRTLAATVERTSHNVDRAVEAMQRSADRIEQSATHFEQSADRIEHQVGVLSEHLTSIDIKIERLTDKIERLADRIDELTRAINGHLEVAKQQSTNIAELTKLVATQANTVAMLISRTG